MFLFIILINQQPTAKFLLIVKIYEKKFRTSFLYFVYFVGKFVPIQIVKDHSKSRYIVFFSTYRETVQEISKIRTNLALDFTNKIQYNFFYKKHICKNSLFVPVLLILFSYVHNFHYFFRDIKN